MAYPKGLKAQKIPLHELTLAVGRKEILAKVDRERGGKRGAKWDSGETALPREGVLSRPVVVDADTNEVRTGHVASHLP